MPHQRFRLNCAAEYSLPYQPQSLPNHWLTKQAGEWVEWWVRVPNRHNLEQNQPFLYQYRLTFRGRFSPYEFRYNALPQADRHRLNQSYPAHRLTYAAWKTVAPYAQWFHTPPNRRVGDIYRWHHRQCVRIFWTLCSSHCSTRAWQTTHGDEQVLSRHEHQAGRAPQSRSLRNQGKNYAFRLQALQGAFLWQIDFDRSS